MEQTFRTPTPLHKDRVMALYLSQDDTRLLSGGADKTLFCQDRHTAEILWQNRSFSHWIQARDCSANSRLTLASCSKGQIYLIETASGQVMNTLQGHHSGITALRFVPGKAEAFSASWDKTLRYWNLRTGLCLQVFEGHSLDVTWLDLGTEALPLVSGSWNRSLKLWNLHGACLQTLSLHSDYVTAVSLLPEGSGIISANKDGSLIAWDLEQGSWR